ncbi:inhibitor of nuclear factor kappa-B kinase subunit alpha [Elysia marginata]|uniref:Inhibitor of nuclear factor kappa-B kinase subunit alpha n=1 Tax=Elysia marginata TaxID=1093978 RepID=A0AAV4J509_9GAST|nr:inhibitor of nuclear factor kappa-B kinase subunit alpha [Elysia marginata]
MVELVAKCFCQGDEHTKTLYNHISNVREQQLELESILKASEQFLQDVSEARTQLVTLQRQRQETMWSIIRNPQLQQQQVSTSELDSNIQFMPSLGNNLESVQLLMDCREFTQKSNSMLKDMLKEQEMSMGYFSSLESNKCINS